MERLQRRVTRSTPAQGSAPRPIDALTAVLRRMFEADLRSLAVLRIVLALIVLIDLANRATNLRIHYSDEGVLPRRVVMDALTTWSWSLGFMSGSVWFMGVLFAVAAIAAIGLLLGYRTRLMTVILWILVSSIDVRNPQILSGGDLLLRMLLFWGMFVPLGAVWSLDRWRQRPAPRYTMRFLSAGSLAIFLQIAFMYWFTAALKTGPEWREDFNALFFVLRRPLYTTPVGEWMQQFTGLLELLSFGTMVVEIAGPILLFSPLWTARCRIVGIVMLMSLHFGIMLTMSIGVFPWISASCMLVFLPTAFWNAVEPRIHAVLRSRAIDLTGIQGALQRSTRVLTHETYSRLRPWNERISLSFSTHSGAPDTESGERPSPPLAARSVDTSAGRDDQGDGQEANRQPAPLRTSLALNVLATCLLLFVFCWNMSTVSVFSMPSQARPIAYSLNIQQNWVMFAPGPPRFNIRYVLLATLSNGQQVDLLLPIVDDNLESPDPFTWEQPANLDTGYYGDMRWRLYLARLGTASRAQRFAFASYVCRTWNSHHDGEMEVTSLVYVYVIEDILPDGTRSNERTTGFGPYSCI